jgi:3-phenylpropionate/trans-cinnamate dioxygenase ferredoxin subunit
VTDFVEVARITDLANGTMRKVNVHGREILLARAGGRYYAADTLCPHLAADLSQGTLRGTILTCPMHRSRFDLTDGRVIRWTDLTGIKLTFAKKARQPRPLTLYPVKIEGEKILVGIEGMKG